MASACAPCCIAATQCQFTLPSLPLDLRFCFPDLDIFINWTWLSTSIFWSDSFHFEYCSFLFAYSYQADPRVCLWSCHFTFKCIAPYAVKCIWSCSITLYQFWQSCTRCSSLYPTTCMCMFSPMPLPHAVCIHKRSLFSSSHTYVPTSSFAMFVVTLFCLALSVHSLLLSACHSHVNHDAKKENNILGACCWYSKDVKHMGFYMQTYVGRPWIVVSVHSMRYDWQVVTFPNPWCPIMRHEQIKCRSSFLVVGLFECKPAGSHVFFGCGGWSHWISVSLKRVACCVTVCGTVGMAATSVHVHHVLVWPHVSHLCLSLDSKWSYSPLPPAPLDAGWPSDCRIDGSLAGWLATWTGQRMNRNWNGGLLQANKQQGCKQQGYETARCKAASYESARL